MQFETTFELIPGRSFLESFEMVWSSALSIGLTEMKSERKAGALFSVCRSVLGPRLQKVRSPEDALPLMAGDDFLFSLYDMSDPSSPENVFFIFRCSGENIIYRVVIIGRVFISNNSSIYDKQVRQRYQLAKSLHELLGACKTVGHDSETDEDDAAFVFSKYGVERRIPQLE